MLLQIELEIWDAFLKNFEDLEGFAHEKVFIYPLCMIVPSDPQQSPGRSGKYQSAQSCVVWF